MDDAELVAETLPWSQKRNATGVAAGVAAFVAFNHLQQEVHMKRTRDPNLTAPRISTSLSSFEGVTPRGYSKGLL